MKKGINSGSLPRHLDFLGKMQLAKKAGFSGIEFSISPNSELSEQSSAAELEAIRKKADDVGIELLALASGMNWQCSLASERKDIREQAKQSVRNQVDIAKVLGIDALLILPGFVTIEASFASVFPRNVPYRPGDEVVDYERAWDRTLEALKELAPYAEKNEITLCVENVWNLFLLSPLEMRRLIDEAASAYIGVYFDVGNVMVQGFPEQWIRILGNRIKRVHFKDFKRSTSQFFGFCDLLTGDVDYRAVKSVLDDIGYEGWVTGEQDLAKQYPEYTVYSCSCAMDYILGKKEEQ